MSATAVIFPGQGSQTPDMREHVARERPDLLEATVSAVGEDPFPRVAEGTRYAQPAILCAGLAAWSVLRDEVTPDLLAGHSLGEIGALVAAGSLSEQEGIELVAVRGRAMEEAGAAAGGGSMLALMGRDATERASEVAQEAGLAVANDNSPQQVVLSGAHEALEAAARRARELGLRAMPLPVAGAFHSPMMAGAVREFRAALDRVDFRAPAVPVISCVTARPLRNVRDTLADGIVRPVRWREVLLALHERGARRFVEPGPGKVLCGLVRRTLPDAEAVAMAPGETARA